MDIVEKHLQKTQTYFQKISLGLTLIFNAKFLLFERSQPAGLYANNTLHIKYMGV